MQLPGHDSEPPVGVILAAGEGRRIRPLSDFLPKSLLPVLDRPLVVGQIEALRSLGVRDVVVVIGHLGQRLVEVLGDGADLGVRLRYVEQTEPLGVAHAVRQVENIVDGPFVLLLGDVYFEAADLAILTAPLARQDVDAVLAVRRETDPEAVRRNFSVEVGKDGFVRAVVEKPSRPRSDLKGCGLYAFRPSIFDAIRRTPRTALRNEYELTDAIQLLIDAGGRVLATPGVDVDFNLSEPAELLALNLHCLRSSGRRRYVAQDAILSEQASVEASVVLSGARIEAGAELERCLVMPGEHVGPGRYQDTIFLGGETIPCRG